MNNQMLPTLKEISKYLKPDPNDGIFSIPEYQRAYSWTKEQCDKLLQDIQNFMASGEKEPYFFGTIILDCSSSDEKDHLIKNLIDGQQRTITFYLLLKALLMKIMSLLTSIPIDEPSREDLISYRNTILNLFFGLEDSVAIHDFINDPKAIKNKEAPIETKSINEKYKDEIFKIISSDSFEEAEKKVHHFPRLKNDNKYTNFFRNFKFFYNAFKDMDSTKIRSFAKTILNKCQVIEIRSWDVEQAIVMFNSLNSKGLPLSDADVISAKLYAKAGGSPEFVNLWDSFYSSVEKLTNLKIATLSDIFNQYMYILRAKDGVEDVSLSSVRKYFIDSNKLDDPIKFVEDITRIANNWDSILKLPIANLLLKFNYNTRFFASSFMFSHGTSSIKKLLEYLLRLFALLEIDDAPYSSKKFKSFLFTENIKLVKESIEDNEIADDFRKHIKANWNQLDLYKDIKTSYRGNLLVVLNEYVYCDDKGYNFYFDLNYNIEHIMPASGKNIETIRKDADIKSIDDFKDIVEMLGNKILLEESINKAIGNEWFKTKKENDVGTRTGYKNSKYAIARDLTTYPSDKWTQDDINTATEKAAKRIANFIFG